MDSWGIGKISVMFRSSFPFSKCLLWAHVAKIWCSHKMTACRVHKPLLPAMSCLPMLLLSEDLYYFWKPGLWSPSEHTILCTFVWKVPNPSHKKSSELHKKEHQLQLHLILPTCTSQYVYKTNTLGHLHINQTRDWGFLISYTPDSLGSFLGQ